MNRLPFALIILLFSSSLFAAPLTVKSTGYDWRKATRTERNAIVEIVLKRLDAPYPNAAMIICLNEVFADPVKPAIHERSMALTMSACHVQIKAEY